MSVQHYLLGYDKSGEELRVEFTIGQDRIGAVRRLIQPHRDDPDILDPYKLDAVQAERIGEAIGQRIDAGAFDWFIQAFAAAPSALPA